MTSLAAFPYFRDRSHVAHPFADFALDTALPSIRLGRRGERYSSVRHAGSDPEVLGSYYQLTLEARSCRHTGAERRTCRCLRTWILCGMVGDDGRRTRVPYGRLLLWVARGLPEGATELEFCRDWVAHHELSYTVAWTPRGWPAGERAPRYRCTDDRDVSRIRWELSDDHGNLHHGLA